MNRPAPAPPATPAPAAQPRAPAVPHTRPAAPADNGPGAAAPRPAGTASTGRRVPAFGPQDPHARAQRLARALVSDIVAYHPERRERSRAAGSLRSEFREEILKSWEEFVAQVGDQVARETPYFRDALNEILAGGQQVF